MLVAKHKKLNYDLVVLRQGWSYQFVSGQVEPEASEGSQYWRG